MVDIDHLYRKVSLCVEIMTNKYLEEKRKGEGKEEGRHGVGAREGRGYGGGGGEMGEDEEGEERWRRMRRGEMGEDVRILQYSMQLWFSACMVQCICGVIRSGVHCVSITLLL